MEKMTYEKIEAVNQEINGTDIKGKSYAEVPQRVKAFRKLYPCGRIETEIVSLENGVVIFKATIYDEENKVLSNGYAYEKENSTFINKTSYIENCETSAVGRALGFLGLGIDTSIASAEEVANAIKQQNTPAVSEELKEQILKAEKMEDLKEIWNNNANLQQNKEFQLVVMNKKNEIKRKEEANEEKIKE